MQNRGYHIFPSKTLCLTVRNILKANPTDFERISPFETFLWIKKGGITFFRWKILVSQGQKNLLSIPAMFQKNFGLGEIYAYEVNHVFLSKISCLTVPEKA